MTAFSLQYSIDVDEETAVVRAKIYGLWKAETANAYHEDFINELKVLKGRPWVKVADLTKWKTSFEKVIEIIGRHQAWARKNNVQLQLYVLDNPSTFRQLNRMFDKGGTADISHIFRTMDEAEEFLKENWLDKQD
ncbi:MAG: hypothetical protein JSU65_06820 [Candidatus Zixiibacteriota bacterium]|nr:MAG: hypothetical protein JSU65_06820 [candidate division Zixibacteria bacterium]